MNEMQVFENGEFGQVRTLMLDNEPWFVAADVCRVLEHSNVTMALDRLEEDERAKFNLGRQGETNIVNESGLYSLVLGSRKPEAKAFKRWVTHEVLPSIRKQGYYGEGGERPGLADYLRAAETLARCSPYNAAGVRGLLRAAGFEIAEETDRNDGAAPRQMSGMVDYDPVRIGTRLRELLNERGMNAVDLARELHVAEATVSRWIQGHNRPRRRDFETICALFGVGAEEFRRCACD